MSYQIYKIIHITSIVLFFSSMGITLYGEKSKALKMGAGIATLLILVSGMGLMARLGIGHRGAWPIWIILKTTIWILLGSSLPIIAKRFPRFSRPSYWFSLIILVVVVAIVQYKP